MHRILSAMGEAERAELLTALGALLSDIGTASTFNLVTALRAKTLDGVGGDLVIHVPRKPANRCEIDWISRAASPILPN